MKVVVSAVLRTFVSITSGKIKNIHIRKTLVLVLTHLLKELQTYKNRGKRPASPMVMVDRGEIFSKGKMATK